MSGIKEFEHLKIHLRDIKSATNNFAEENCIGRGGFGKVYKGDLVHSKGKSTVAIKRLDRTLGQGDPEFWKEIMMLSVYEHENIVSLLGFCYKNDERILVYEYVSRRSLNLYLDSDDLTWSRRLKICIGAARGLAYLHNPAGTQQRVLHRDIKSYNILLDENWDAKIADFGLSKLGPANQQRTYMFSHPVGTSGYCDPLYAEMGLLTKESDVYSFGVVLFEVLCGRLCIGNNNDRHDSLTKLAIQCYEKNKMNDIICGNIRDEIYPKSLETFTKLAYQCLQRDREERPLMADVVKRLESALEHQGGDDEKIPLATEIAGVLETTLEYQEVGRALPKFGDWDVNDPASAAEFTLIFNKAKNEKKTGRTTESPPKSDSTHHKPEAATTLGKPQRRTWCCFKA